MCSPGCLYEPLNRRHVGADVSRKAREGTRMLTRAVQRLEDRRRREADGGFTLIEIVVALGIISTTLLALLGGFIAAAHSQQAEKTRTIALRLANETMESLRSQSY